MWVFRVDQEQLILPSCDDNFLGMKKFNFSCPIKVAAGFKCECRYNITERVKVNKSTCVYSGSVMISPRFGNMLGGTLVTLSGPCFDETDSIECVFAGTTTPGVYVSRDSVACITPAMNAIGNVEVSLIIKPTPNRPNGFQGSTSFYSSEL